MRLEVGNGAVVLGDFLLKQRDAAGERQCLTGEDAVAHLEVSGAKGGSEGLIDFVVGKLLGFACVLCLLIGCGGGGESVRGLPGGCTDDGLTA